MRRANNKVVGGIVLLAIILVAVGYAAITNVTLNINGTAKSEASQNNFVVEFIGTPTISGKGTTTATINENKKTEGNIRSIRPKRKRRYSNSNIYSKKSKSRFISRFNSRSNKLK